MYYLPGYFEYPQKPHGSENTNTERGVGVKLTPNYFK